MKNSNDECNSQIFNDNELFWLLCITENVIKISYKHNEMPVYWHLRVMLCLICFADFSSYPPFAIEILRYGTRDHTVNFFLKTSGQGQIHI